MKGQVMDQHTRLLLTILIPTWNRAKLVLEAVESVGPISSDMEIVIVDNASKSAIFEELQRYLGSRPGIRLFSNERNLGMVRNWNRCLEEAHGEWLGLLCSDDRYRPGAITRLRKIVGSRPEPAMIIQDTSIDGTLDIYPPGSETVRNLRLPIGSGNFWHRRVYEQIGGFDERFEYSADAEYWYRAAFSFPVVKVREPFAVYVPHEDSYMWATWRRPDYLQQTELLARTVAGYAYAASPDRATLIELRVTRDIWQTLLSILRCTFLTPGMGDIFHQYFIEALRHAGTLAHKKQLLSVLFGTAIRRCRKLIISMFSKRKAYAL
jgi:glycosyltransferase involved in cell wall biosynthesis